MPPPTAGEYSILAVVKTVVDGEDTWKLAGRLDILAREHKTYNVTMVPLASGHSINKEEVRDSLNSTWNKYGISWEVDVDNAFYVNAADDDYNKQFINGFISIVPSSAYTTSVAWWAHIGGFVCGLLTFTLFITTRKPPPRRLQHRRPQVRIQRRLPLPLRSCLRPRR